MSSSTKKDSGYKDTPPEITVYEYVEAYFNNGQLMVLEDMSDKELAENKELHDLLRKYNSFFKMKRRASPAQIAEYEKEQAEEEAAKPPPPRQKGKMQGWSY